MPTGSSLVAMLLPVVLLTGCRGNHSSDTSSARRDAASPATSAQEWFVDASGQSGLDFVHVNGMSGRFYFPETMGPGVAMFDYDNDGDLDIYLVQGEMLSERAAPDQVKDPPLKDRLYRNDLQIQKDGKRTLHFTDVTMASGVAARGYGMGAATGDYDNDGCVDLYLTNLRQNQMFRNNCDGTFTDASQRSRTEDPGWSVSASFLDFDRDGWLDLFVGHYLNYSLEANVECFSVSGQPDYCSPNTYRAQPSHLYHNNRNGTFTDVSVESGVSTEFGPALGLAPADFDGDGWIDVYVANDSQPNQLWMNQRDGTFRNAGFISGSALNADGKPEASMGVDAGDFDGDGDEDLFITNLTGQGSVLYVNNGSGMFEDRGTFAGLRQTSIMSTGFGTAWFDFDNDGWLDVLTVNGAVKTIESLARNHDPFPLHQRKQLFRNLGNGRFDEVTNRAGAVFELSEVGRGAAFGDVDNDGDPDVVVGNNSGRVRLLLNQVGGGHWLGLRLVGERGRRDMVGARVAVMRSGRPTLWRRSRSDESYASASDPRVLVGLGVSVEAPDVRIVWPSGRVEEWTGVPIDRYTTFEEGTGTAAGEGGGK